MSPTPHPRRRPLRTLLLALVLAAAPLSLGLPAGPAQAAGSVSVDSALGAGVASADAATRITVTGVGLQSIPKAFGGIYVVFGYAPNPGAWSPSQGGTSGSDFFYIADSQAKDNAGYQRFVAFPGSSTSDTANGGTLTADGGFSLSMVIPGPTFSAESASGGMQTFDCRQVQCGIFTFGAHGVINANNETFTPISFGAAAAPAAPAVAAPAAPANPAGDAAAAPAVGAEAGAAAAAAAPVAGGAAPQALAATTPQVGLTQKTVMAGRVLGFTAQGFAPGEQVVATLTSGVTAAGPLVAGTFGELAGAVQIPGDLAAGTHKITLLGAGSQATATAEFSVMTNPATLAVAADDTADGTWWALVVVLIAGGLLFLLLLTSLITTLVRRSRRPAKKRPATAQTSPAATRRRAPGAAPTAPAGSSTATASTEPETATIDVVPPRERELV